MRLRAAILLLTLPIASHAQGYIGAGIGSFDYSEQGDHVTVLSDLNDTASSYSLYGGYEFFKYLAVEGSWGRSGEIHGTVPIVVPGRGPLNFDISGQYDIASVRAVGFVPVGKKTRLLGSLGMYDLRLKSTGVAPSFPTVNSDTDDTGLGLMLGAQIDFGHVALRARYETSNLDLADFGIGLSVRF